MDRREALPGAQHAGLHQDPQRLPDLFVNEHHLCRVPTEYLIHYNTARPHRSLGQLPPAQAHARPPQIDLAEHRVGRKQVLGGLTYEYQIAA